MWKFLLNTALFGIAITLCVTMGSMLLLLVAGEGCVGHGICGLGVVALFGILFGPLVCLVCVPMAASVLAANPTWKNRANMLIVWAGAVFLIVAGSISLFQFVSNLSAR
jgi:hypothetical protein